MTVKAILSAKGSTVVTIEPTSTLATASQLLSEHRIGAVIVTGADDRVIGMLSERDIVHALAAKGADALNLKVSEAMTRRVVTCTEADTVSVIMERMTFGKFRHLPVVMEEKLVGIVSIGDVVKHRLGQIEAEKNALQDYIQTA